MDGKELVKEMIRRQKNKANESIEMTADDLWKYSGKIEEDSDSYKLLKCNIVAKKPAKKSRKEYFRLYWQKYKLKKKKK